MNNFLSKRWKVLSLSLSLLIAGCILFNGEIDYSIVGLVNRILSINLNIEFRAFGLEYLATLLIYASITILTWYFQLSGKITRRQFAFLSVIFLILHYTYHVVINSVNYPIFDDQGAVYDFLNQYTGQPNAKGKLHALLMPYNEAWMLFPRFILLTFLSLFHEFNLNHLFLFNAGVLAFFFFLLTICFQKTEAFPYLLIPALLLFQLQYFNTIFIAISGLCYYWVLIFALGSIYFLVQRTKKGKYLALIFACAASITFGNGLLLFPLSIIYLVCKRQWLEAMGWLAALCVFLFLLSGTFLQIQFAGEFTMDVSYWILFIPTLLGSAFQFFYTVHIPVIAGCLVILTFVVGIFRKWYDSSPPLFWMLAFVILSAASAAPFRSAIRPGGYYGLEVRYGFFSIISVVLAVMLLIENSQFFKRKQMWFLIGSFAYNILSGFFFYPEAPVRTQRLEAFVKDAHQNKFNLEYSPYRKAAFDELMKSSIEKGIYKP
jgi:hypothetical protein